MRVQNLYRTLLAVCAVSVSAHGLVPTCLAGQPGKAVPGVQQNRVTAMQLDGAEASLTIFPVVLCGPNRPEEAGQIGTKVADVVGVMLEEAGMVNLEATDLEFVLPEDADFGQAAGYFGEFVRRNPIETDYALYTEFVGHRGAGRIGEVRAIIVDRAGGIVWTDRQTPNDPDFKRIKPGDPMTCCVLLTERVRTLLGIPDSARADSGTGRFARKLAKESLVPDKAEWAAMEQRQAIMKEAGRKATVAVYPVRLSDDEVGENDAAHLAKLLSNTKLCDAQAVDSPLHVKIVPDANEQKLLWQLARTFQDHIKRNPPEADYSLLADYRMRPNGKGAWTVHFVVCDRDGEWVVVDYQNDHHSDFQSIDPRTTDKCGTLVAKRLEGYLR